MAPAFSNSGRVNADIVRQRMAPEALLWQSRWLLWIIFTSGAIPPDSMIRFRFSSRPAMLHTVAAAFAWRSGDAFCMREMRGGMAPAVATASCASSSLTARLCSAPAALLCTSGVREERSLVMRGMAPSDLIFFWFSSSTASDCSAPAAFAFTCRSLSERSIISASTPPAAATVFLLEALTQRFWRAPAADSCASRTSEYSIATRGWMAPAWAMANLFCSFAARFHSAPAALAWTMGSPGERSETRGWIAPFCAISTWLRESRAIVWSSMAA
mmetsp:Transcript_27995/g.56390  ORF Transcript_27995/g.56390 Transcript_27995/m.56390 type:complete len:272 (-) Transcript_27995:75-890(-)